MKKGPVPLLSSFWTVPLAVVFSIVTGKKMAVLLSVFGKIFKGEKCGGSVE